MRSFSRLCLPIILPFGLIVVFTLGATAQEKHKMAYEAYKRGNYAKAVVLFKQVVEEHPDWVFGHYMLGASYKAAGELYEAIRPLYIAASLSETADDKFKAYYCLSDCYYDLREYIFALPNVTLALSLENAEGYSKALDNMIKIKGISEFHLGKYEEAINTLIPLLASGRADLCIKEMVDGRNLKFYKDFLTFWYDKEYSLDIYCDIYARKKTIIRLTMDKKWIVAITVADKAIVKHPREWVFYYLKGYAEFRSGEINEAVQSLDKALLVKDNGAIHRLLGDIHAEAKCYDKAVSEYKLSLSVGDYIRDPEFLTNFAFYWFQYVPCDCEKYHGKPEEAKYTRILKNVVSILILADSLPDADKGRINFMFYRIMDKMERLSKGYSPDAVQIDPETGKIIERKKKDK
jgi:tetratricopeptide (TPR) repeat protein